MQKEFWRYLETLWFYRHFVANFLEILVFENSKNPEILDILDKMGNSENVITFSP